MIFVLFCSFDGIKLIIICLDIIIDRIEDIEFVNIVEIDVISVIDILIIDVVLCNFFILCSVCNKVIGVFNLDVNIVKCLIC